MSSKSGVPMFSWRIRRWKVRKSSNLVTRVDFPSLSNDAMREVACGESQSRSTSRYLQSRYPGIYHLTTTSLEYCNDFPWFLAYTADCRVVCATGISSAHLNGNASVENCGNELAVCIDAWRDWLSIQGHDRTRRQVMDVRAVCKYRQQRTKV